MSLNKLFICTVLFLFTIEIFAVDRYWIGTTNNNWNETGNWSTTSGGAGGASVPIAGDRALFNSNGNVNLTLDMAPTIGGIDISVGFTATIDLNGNNLTINGAINNDFEDGTFNNTSGGALSITSTATTQLRGTTFNPDISVTSNRLYLNGSVYNGTAIFTKNGAGNDVGTGGNTFNGTTSFICSGSGYLMTGNTASDTYNGALTCTNTGTSGIYLAYNSAGTQFNQNIVVNSTNGLGVRIGQNSNGSATLAATRTITIGGSGFTAGELRLKDVTLTGATNQNLALTGTGYLYLDGCDWGGNVVFSAPRVYTRDSRFRGTATLTKNGTSNDQSPGGNQFDGNVVLNCSGGGYFMMGNGTADNFAADVTMNNTGTSGIYLANNGPGHTLGGNLSATNSGSGTTAFIYVCAGGTANLNITGNFNMTVSGTATNCHSRIADNGVITIGGNLTWTNTANVSSTETYIAQSATSAVTINGDLTVANGGGTSNGRFYIGSNGDVTVNGNMSLTNTSTATNSLIYCNNSSNSTNIYNGNIIVESTGAGTDGVYFGESGGSSTLAATRTISVGGGGFTSGDLRIRNFTQTGSTAQSLAIAGTGALDIHDCDFGGNVVFSSPRMFTRGTRYRGTCTLTKNGAGDDQSLGGNQFDGNTILNCSSAGGYFLMGNGTGDTFGANVTMNNTGSRNMYLAYNSAGNSIAGDLTINQATSGTNSYIYISDGATAALSIGGNAIVNVTSSASNSRVYFSDDGDINLTGNLTLTNSGTGTSSEIYASQNATSLLTIGGNTIITNTGASTTKRVYFGNQGDIALTGDLSISNISSATNSQVYCNHNTNSVATYGGNITVESTNAACDGVFFGNAGGSSTLAATRTISVGGGGFISGDLYFRNFTQTGATAQSLAITGGTGIIYNYDSDWGGDVVFSGPRMITRGTHYRGTSSLTKNGASDDRSAGGNTFDGDAILNCTNAGYILMSDGTADTYGGNLTVNNSGTRGIYLAYNGAGNTIAGNLTATNSGTGSSTWLYFSDQIASTLAITGNVDITASASSTTSSERLGREGDVTVGGNVTWNRATTSTTPDSYIAQGSNSSVTIQGDLNYTQSGGGANARMFIGENGDITVNGDMTLINSSTAGSSRISCNQNANSVGVYNGNIILSSTIAGSDGVFFGNSGGSATLAATRTISVGAGGFISGDLYLRRFTQVGPTAQTFTNSGTGLIFIENSNWGGNIDFTSGRIISQFNTYQGTLTLEKTAGSRDESDGGNTVTGNAIITNSGSGELRFGDGTNDVFSADVTLNNSGSSTFYFAYRAPASTIGGNLIMNNTGSVSTSNMYLCSVDTSGLNITGNATAHNAATSTNEANIYFAHVGDVNVSGNLTTTNSATANNSRIVLANSSASSLAVTGNVSLTGTNSSNNHINFIGEQGDVTIGGTLTVDVSASGTNANTYVANNALSTVTIGGNASFINTGAGTTKRMYLGHYGDVTFNGDLDIENTSSATNSQIYCNHQPGSVNAYNGNITLENSNAASDGVFFGTSNAGGSGTLAATRTVTASGGGITAGDIYFKNFTQVGATPQSLVNSGLGYIYNWDSDWGGNISFSSGRIVSRGTTYQGTSVLTKTGASDDRNSRGNTFTGNCTLNNQGSGYLLFGDGAPDTFSANLTMNNSGSHNMYLAYNSAGNSITGNLVINNTANVTTTRYIYISDLAASTLSIGGNATITNSPSNSAFNFYFGDDGDVTLTGDLVINSNSTGTSSNISVAQNATSLVTIGGNATLTNTSSGSTTHNSYFGNSGDVTLTGNLILNNNTTSTNGTAYIASGSGSTVSIGGTATLTNSGAGNDKRIYFGNNGDVTVTSTLSITNSSSATNSHIYCNDRPSSVGTYNGNIVVESTNAASDGVWFGWQQGTGTLAATRTITVGGGGFIGGDLRFRNFTQVGPTAQTLTNTGTGYIYNYDSDWGGNVTFSSGRMYTRGTAYQGTSSLTKTNAGDDRSPGGNAFTGNTSLINNGTNTFSMGEGSPDTFGADLTMTNNSNRFMYIARNSAGNTIGGNFTVTDNGTGTDNRIYISDNTNSTLVVTGTTAISNLSNATSSTIYVGNSGDITFNNNVTLINNGTGANAEVRMANATNSAVIINGNLSATNSASGTTKRIRLTENGDLTVSGNLTAVNSSTATTGEMYSGMGSTSVVSIGGNSSYTNTGAGTTKRTYIGYNGDMTFNGDLSISNTSSATNSEVYCNDRGNGLNMYNGNITVENTNASGDGVRFGQNGGSGILANTRTITVSGGGFVAGELRFRNFTQTGGTAQALALTGTAYMVQYDAAWGGNVNFEAPRFYTRGTTYSGTSDLEKTGATDDASPGGNSFTGACIMRNSGSGYFLMGNGTADTWASGLTMIATGSDNMYIAHNSAGNAIGGNLTATNNGTGTVNIYISNENASSLTIGGNATLTNAGSGSTSRCYFGRRGDITLSGDLSITNSSAAGNSQVYCNQETNSLINYGGNISLESTNASCDGIYFGSSNGNATQSAGGSISTGGAGYVAGELQIRNFTQLGNAASTLTLTGTARYYPYTSSFGGNMTVSAPRYYGRTTTYSGDFSLTMTGSTNNDSYGDNTFNGNVTINMGSSGRLRLANNVANDYNGNATFIKTAGTLHPAYNQPSTFAGDINVNSNSQLYLAQNNGTIIWDGSAAQSFNDLGASGITLVRRMTLNNTSTGVTLNAPIEIPTTVTFTDGVLNTSTSGLVYIRDNATVTGASDASHVDGPIEKIGNDDFTFPTGDNGQYREIRIASHSPNSSSGRFRAQYFEVDPTTNWAYGSASYAAGIEHISTTEYWILDRVAGSNNVYVWLYWDTNSGGVTDINDLLVARWDGVSLWDNHGGGNFEGNTTAGRLRTPARVTTFSPFVLASNTNNNPLPVELTKFEAKPNSGEKVVDLFWITSSEINNDFFTVEKTKDLNTFEEVVQVAGQGTTNEQTEYHEKDYNPSDGISYYRLSQTDFDGKTEYFDLEKVLFELSEHPNDMHVELYPNPSNGHNMYMKIPNADAAEINVLINDFIGKSYLTDFTVINQGEYSVVAIEMNQKLAAGSYMINVSVDGENHSHKLIVQ